MDLGIKGRKAIVNGGSAGLGFASAMALAREGADLFVSARGEERLVEACTAISTSTGASVTPIVADHSSEDGRERIPAACTVQANYITGQSLVVDGGLANSVV